MNRPAGCWSCCTDDNTPFCGSVFVPAAGWLYLLSGQFSSTINDSEDVGSVSGSAEGISWDGTNTPWTGVVGTKLYLQSGQFTSTISESEDVSGVNIEPNGISWDGTNTPWAGTSGNDTLYLQSGQFTSTIKTNADVSANGAISGISWDDLDTLVSQNNKLMLYSGQFSSTILNSEDVSATDTGVSDISWDGTNTLWAGTQHGKLYCQSGKFSSTVKSGLAVNPIISVSILLLGINTNLRKTG